MPSKYKKHEAKKRSVSDRERDKRRQSKEERFKNGIRQAYERIEYYPLSDICDYCGGSVTIKNRGIRMGLGDNYYSCDKCGASVSCHLGTYTPMGRLADRELKKIRKKLHKLIDSLWQTRKERSQIYSIMRELYMPNSSSFHVAWLSNEEALNVLEDLKKQFGKS